MKKTLQILIILITAIAFSQENDHLKFKEHIFWQENVKLKTADFKNDGKNIPNAIKYCDTIGLCTVGAFGIFAVLDVPKKNRKRSKLKEKLYIVPAFELPKSYRIKNDSLGVEKQQVVFDIYELSARWMRRELTKLTKTMNAYGALSIWFKTIENDAMQMNKAMVDGFTTEVFILGKENAYEDWRKKIDQLLAETNEFKTAPEEINRFITGKPLIENYKMADQLMGYLFD